MPHVAEQVASTLQPPLSMAQRLSGVQLLPLPIYPGSQVHTAEPPTLAQVAVEAQPPLFMAHALMAVQVLPFPV